MIAAVIGMAFCASMLARVMDWRPSLAKGIVAMLLIGGFIGSFITGVVRVIYSI